MKSYFLCLLGVLGAACTQLEQPLPASADASIRPGVHVGGSDIGFPGPIKGVPQVGHQTLYLPLNRSLRSQAGTLQPTDSVAITYGPDRRGAANGAAYFNGSSSIVEFVNGYMLMQPSMTCSYWMKLDTNTTHGHWTVGMDFFRGFMMEFNTKADNFKTTSVFARSNSTVPDSLYILDMWTGESVGDRDHSTVFTRVPAGGYKAVLAQRWAHITYTYDAASKKRTLFVNGVAVLRQDLTQATSSLRRVTGTSYMPVSVDPTLSNGLALGFGKTRAASLWEDPSTEFGMYASPRANHYKGALDEVRFFNVALTDAEVAVLYRR